MIVLCIWARIYEVKCGDINYNLLPQGRRDLLTWSATATRDFVSEIIKE
jgi:hypothetical protein